MTEHEVDAPACYRHGDRETWIRCGRCERPICPECMIPAAVGFQCPECVKEGSRSVRPTRTPFGARARGGTPVTFTLLGLNVLMFVLTVSDLFRGTLNATGVDLALIEGPVKNGEYYRLLTSMFLHFGLIHLGLNMYCLVLVGQQLEPILGRWRFAALYLVSGLGGSVATYLFAGGNSISAGASGAVFGLFAGLFVVARRLRADTGPILMTIGINLVFTFTIPEISKTGHVGGLVVGAIMAAVFAFIPAGPRRTLLHAGGVALVLALLGLGIAIGPSTPQGLGLG
jgi:membrane associated rhomboid family serine protease